MILFLVTQNDRLIETVKLIMTTGASIICGDFTDSFIIITIIRVLYWSQLNEDLKREIVSLNYRGDRSIQKLVQLDHRDVGDLVYDIQRGRLVMTMMMTIVAAMRGITTLTFFKDYTGATHFPGKYIASKRTLRTSSFWIRPSITWKSSQFSW